MRRRFGVSLCAIKTNGEKLDVDEESAAELERQGIIYACGACSEDDGHPDIFHISEGCSWGDVDRALGVEVI